MPRASSRSSSRPRERSACADDSSSRARCGSLSSLPATMLSPRATETRRCCAPSWRLRSSRCRSASPTSTSRAARGRQLLVRVGVRQRLRDEVREVAQPLLDAVRERVVGGAGRRQRAPHPPADVDRRRDRGPVAGAPQRGGQRPARTLVAVDARGGAACARPARATVSLSMSSRRPTGKLGGPFSLHAPTTVTVRAPSYWTMFAPGSPSSRADLFGRLLEHPARRRLAGHQRRHPAQRRLLVRQRALRRLGGRQLARRADPLGGHRGEQQRGDRRDGDEELRREQAVGERVAHERSVVLRPCSRP